MPDRRYDAPGGELGEMLCTGNDRQTMRSSGAEVERGAFHCLSDIDSATRTPCVWVAGNPATNWKTPGSVRGEPAPEYG